MGMTEILEVLNIRPNQRVHDEKNEFAATMLALQLKGRAMEKSAREFNVAFDAMLEQLNIRNNIKQSKRKGRK